VEIFAEERLAVHPARFLIAFLCLQTRVSPTNDCRHLLQMAHDWDTANRTSVVVMPPLPLVRQEDLQTWPAIAESRLNRIIQLGEAEIGSIFEAEPRRYMQHVAHALKDRLQPQFDSGPRVADPRR
jgi:hypothetical protein